MKTSQALIVAASALFLAACNSTPCCSGCEESDVCLVEESEAASWQDLFDGESTAGWVNYNQDTISDGWQVVDGELTMTGSGGDIVTEQVFGDFELMLDWKIAENGNSGIFFNVLDGQDAVWRTGIEMQVLDNERHYDGKNPFTSAGSCYALYEPVSDVTKKPGEWNSVRIVHQDSHVEHWLNGTLVCEYTIGSDEWNQLVSESKFNEMPLFGKSAQGRIALQDHGDLVAYRNIRIREI
jgi:hypothetical protein